MLSSIVEAQSPCPPLADARSHVRGANPTAGFPDAKAFSCRFNATLTRMFTPRAVPEGTYRVYVTDTRIEKVLVEFREAASSSNVEGAWVLQGMDPLDAYGDSGLYDRAKIARLYVGGRAHVARGPIVEHGRTVASITLVSPYPDVSLTRLEAGTLIIEYRISSE